jgi:hypothetical protein
MFQRGGKYGKKTGICFIGGSIGVCDGQHGFSGTERGKHISEGESLSFSED